MTSLLHFMEVSRTCPNFMFVRTESSDLAVQTVTPTSIHSAVTNRLTIKKSNGFVYISGYIQTSAATSASDTLFYIEAPSGTRYFTCAAYSDGLSYSMYVTAEGRCRSEKGLAAGIYYINAVYPI